MGFKLNLNYILRQDVNEKLIVGQEYSFEKMVWQLSLMTFKSG